MRTIKHSNKTILDALNGIVDTDILVKGSDDESFDSPVEQFTPSLADGMVIEAAKEMRTISPSDLKDGVDYDADDWALDDALLAFFAPYTEGDWSLGDIFNRNDMDKVQDLLEVMYKAGKKYIVTHPDVLSQTYPITIAKSIKVVKDGSIWRVATKSDEIKHEERLKKEEARYKAISKLTLEERKLLGV
jgi:hypothetical protein